MPRQSNYDKFPYVPTGRAEECALGWDKIAARLAQTGTHTICVECYPGADAEQIERELGRRLKPRSVIRTADCLKSPQELRTLLQPFLTDDRIFGRMNALTLEDYFDTEAAARARQRVVEAQGSLLVIGSGAALLAPHADALVLADMARWEIQRRFRSGVLGNLGLDNAGAGIEEQYKCGYFVEWRAADRLKQQLLPRADFLLDTNDAQAPKLVGGNAFRRGLAAAARRPFRVVPFFDPGPWGGHWMEEVCDLPTGVPNHAWCFDCVPEENSLLLGFGETRVEVPALDLVFTHPRELLGGAVYERFGAEFPIRFDFLDTMGGGNLSLQVHPLTEYIHDAFGMNYTQDESYYLLDAAEDACVFLGLKDGVDRVQMVRDLRAAQDGAIDFPAEKYVNRWPAAKHDHFLIPAGTVHCSGRNSMVLEISSTPYIFTFKLWDWGRPGLDGRPRPINVDRGVANVQWERTTEWTRTHLVNRVHEIARGDGWREESTGLHERGFIETHRHWFTGTAPHDTRGTLHVLNLVQGEEAVIESPAGAFEPFVVHYAETFIVPASVGAYTLRPCGKAAGTECATILAFVRTETKN